MRRETVVYLVATFLVAGSLIGSVGASRVRIQQAESARATPPALDENAIGNGSGDPAAEPAPSGAPNATAPPRSATPATPSAPKNATTTTVAAKAALPADRDGDRVPDATDRCPTKPETFNGFADQDGCPDAITRTRTS